jgi:GAF domain-containing protein
MAAPFEGRRTVDLGWLEARLAKATDVEGVLRDATARICKAFKADRLTIYRASDDGTHLSSIVQAGIESFGSVKVRVDSNRSVAGYAAANRRVVNIRDAYDDAEMAALQLTRKMFLAVDERTGFRTTQVLAAPIVSATDKLLGVVEFLNREDDRRFPQACEADAKQLCALLATALGRALAKETS